jgi:hypothetical protein
MMETNDNHFKGNQSTIAIILFTFQLIAWVVALNPVFSEYRGSDPAGNGLAKGLAVLFMTVPCMIYIFGSNIYFVLKKTLSMWYKIYAVMSFLGLIVLYNYINW